MLLLRLELIWIGIIVGIEEKVILSDKLVMVNKDRDAVGGGLGWSFGPGVEMGRVGCQWGTGKLEDEEENGA